MWSKSCNPLLVIRRANSCVQRQENLYVLHLLSLANSIGLQVSWVFQSLVNFSLLPSHCIFSFSSAHCFLAAVSLSKPLDTSRHHPHRRALFRQSHSTSLWEEYLWVFKIHPQLWGTFCLLFLVGNAIICVTGGNAFPKTSTDLSSHRSLKISKNHI